MRLKPLFFSGVAAFALCTLPAAAYTHHPSTPEEQAQTDQLNEQQLAKAQQTDQQTALAQQQNPQTDTQANSAMPAANAQAPLNTMINPPSTLASASVETSSGQPLGAVQKVAFDASGKPSSVDIALAGENRTVKVDASQLSYDSSRNVVVAQMDADQLKQMPTAAQTPQG